MTRLSRRTTPAPVSRRAFAAAVASSLLTGCAGQGPGRTATTPSGSTPPSPTGSTSPSPSPSPASRASRASPAPAEPVGLRIPAIGVDTPVIRLGLTADGTVQVPPATAGDRAGWYRHSPPPGQTGPSVILGHVTVGAHGDGVFRHLARLRRGDRITVRLENGRTTAFAVGSVRTVAQAEFPTDDVYGDVRRPELRLITCGGPRTAGGYRDSVIVFAAPAEPDAPKP
ncbi:class F sortase [Streptomyces sp. F63]|uniref:class F sortase n=1 Tax=Streptomyces sp. F63 TaxID=2824887 RepID=UPI001B3809B7|nr:class F sortase [Streptomyces sp. F63]MBQ0983374.1 class F sortase [Streptomyces sp. F63]